MRLVALVTATLAVTAAAPLAVDAAGATRINGTYITSFTQAQFLAKTTDPEENNPANWGQFRMVFRNGHFTNNKLNGPKAGGSYTITGNTITMHPTNQPEVWHFHWKLSADSKLLTFVKIGHIGPTGFTVKPWKRIA